MKVNKGIFQIVELVNPAATFDLLPKQRVQALFIVYVTIQVVALAILKR